MVDFCALPANVPAGIPTMISTNGPRFSLIGMSLFGFSTGFLPEIPGKNSAEFAQNGSVFRKNGAEFGKYGSEFTKNGAEKTESGFKKRKGRRMRLPHRLQHPFQYSEPRPGGRVSEIDLVVKTRGCPCGLR